MTSQEDKDIPCPTCGLSKAAFLELSKLVEELTHEIAELKKRLSAYENSNTPPSKNYLIYREMKKKRNEERQNGSKLPPSSATSNNNKKLGRKNAHKGVTQTFEPNGEPIIHTLTSS